MFKALKALINDVKTNVFTHRRFYVHSEGIGIYSQVVVWELDAKLDLKEFGKINVDREDATNNDDILKIAETMISKANVPSYTLRIF